MEKIIIFDLDGTLLNTLEDLKDSTNYALEQFQYPQRNLDEIRNFVGNGVKLLIERAIPQGIENPNFEKCLQTFKEHYSKNMYNKTAPYPEIINMLKKLKEKNYKIAVVSNKFDAAVKELCKKYFKDLIDIAIGENEAAGINKKPAPDTVFKAIFELNGTVSKSVYVGDSDVDIQTAKNSFMPCISVSWGFRDKEFLIKNGAKIIIDKPNEIFDVL
ncbi:MAG: HAD family hydrolase [Candidatus Gastranaerophilaceae bacterium]